jgi:uncharacterized protein YraI
MLRKIFPALFLIFVLLAAPLAAFGQVEIQARVVPDLLNVRAAPKPDAPVLGQFTRDMMIRLTGRENSPNDGGVWVYGTPVDGGLTGWMLSTYLEFPSDGYVFTLPVVDVSGIPAAENPPAQQPTIEATPTTEAPPAQQPVAEGQLAGTTTITVNLRSGPGTTFLILREVPARTSVALAGRNYDGKWFKAIVGDQQGWLFADYVSAAGDPATLPLVTDSGETPADGAPAAVAPPAIPSAVVPAVGSRARQIYLTGQRLGNRRDVFSKVGDSITASGYFLTPIGLGGLNLGQYTNLQPVVNFFSQTYANDHISFANTSLAAWGGWTSGDLLNPERVISSVCQAGESPLVCEYRVTKPSVALIMIGTNDVYFGVDSATYRANLDTIVKTSINMGVIPVLSTIPDNLQDPNLLTRIQEFNGIVASVASANGIPLWNYWQAMQGLNNHGLSGDGYHPSTSPTGEAAVFTPDALQYGFNIRNLTALMVLDAVWRGALY